MALVSSWLVNERWDYIVNIIFIVLIYRIRLYKTRYCSVGGFYLHLQDVGGHIWWQLCHNSPLWWIQIWDTHFGPTIWTPNMDPQYGPRFWTEPLIWDPDLGPRFRTPIWDPDLGPRFGTPIWDPDLGPRFGTSIWDPDFIALHLM
jgi:hypothetical protein